MIERGSGPPIQYLYSRKLSKLTGIPQGRWMMSTNHIELGGGFKFYLGSIHDRKSCILIRDKNAYLWEINPVNPIGHWKEVKKKEIIEWSQNTLEATRSSLRKASEYGLLSVMFNHS